MIQIFSKSLQRALTLNDNRYCKVLRNFWCQIYKNFNKQLSKYLTKQLKLWTNNFRMKWLWVKWFSMGPDLHSLDYFKRKPYTFLSRLKLYIYIVNAKLCSKDYITQMISSYMMFFNEAETSLQYLALNFHLLARQDMLNLYICSEKTNSIWFVA